MSIIKAKYSNYGYGVFLCILAGGIAILLSNQYQAPVMLFSVLLGLALHSFYQSSKYQVGVDFCSSTLLRIAVSLLGVRIVFSDVMDIGLLPVLIVLVGMIAAMLSAKFICRLFNLPTYFGTLAGASVAICGVSAAAAISSVLPNYKDSKKYFALTVVGITCLSTFSMITFPLVSQLFELNVKQTGIFLGGSIHDVAQVVGAGYSHSEKAGDTSIIVKLFRVMLLMPIVVLIFMTSRDTASAQNKGLKLRNIVTFVPPFLIAFIVIALINNMVNIPSQFIDGINSLSKNFIVIAMVAIGMKTSFAQLASLGVKPIFVMVASTLMLASTVLCGVLLSIH